MRVHRYLSDEGANNSIHLRLSVSNNPTSQGFCRFRGCIGSVTSQSSLSIMVCGLTPPSISCKDAVVLTPHHLLTLFRCVVLPLPPMKLARQ
jgi:hypothetical protein